ncbi:MAG: hypothetical protein ACRD6I_20710, partial [Candidatus Acidiferrales bacterium]
MNRPSYTDTRASRTDGLSLAQLLFWSWNLIFVTFMLLGFAPTVLPEMLTAVRSNMIPASFLLYALVLTMI